MLASLSLVIACILLVLAALPLAQGAQIQFSLGLLLLLLLLRPLVYGRLPFDNRQRFLRILFILLALLLSIRYFWWRTFNTLPFEDPLSLLPGLILYGAELFAFAVLLVGAFVYIQPLNRPVLPMPKDRSRWPTVDVLIPTYDEPDSVIELTLLGALAIDYPADKIKVWLLDDGATRAKRTQPDPDKARAARERGRRLRKLCARLGAHYLTRERNESAKAGNINHALRHIRGEFVLVLDADHVPTRDILTNMLGWMIKDPQIFLVQSPHFFVTPDPIEKNLKTFQQMPSEQEMFYTDIQRGLDFWNASFFCGAAAVLRRSCLDEIGGFQGKTITEDAETALALHARGYRSAYIWQPMIAGLQPESFISFVKQRSRWAQGMTQILILSNPLRIPGLKWWQRLSYLNSMLFWLFPFARLVFLISPLFYLLLGLGIFNASVTQVLILALPHFVSLLILNDYLYGNARWVFVSEFYEQLLSLFLLKPLIDVFRRPRSPQFLVTPKGEVLEQDAVSPLAKPVYAMLMLAFLGLAMGVWRYFAFPDERDTVILLMAWEMLNLILLFGALGALIERQQRRAAVRIPCQYAVEIHAGGRRLVAETHDLSLEGVGLIASPKTTDWLRRHPPEWIRIYSPRTKFGRITTGRLPAQIQNIRRHKGMMQIGLRIQASQPDDRRTLVVLMYSSSRRWRGMLRQRDKRIGVRRAILFLFRLALRYVGEHLRLVLRHALAGSGS